MVRGVRFIPVSMLVLLSILICLPSAVAIGQVPGDAEVNRLFDFDLAPDDGTGGGDHDGSFLAENGWLFAEVAFLLLIIYILWTLSRPPRERRRPERPPSEAPQPVTVPAP